VLLTLPQGRGGSISGTIRLRKDAVALQVDDLLGLVSQICRQLDLEGELLLKS
jgi:hypothetical protein